MASIGFIGEESFLSQVERVRSEIRDKFLRVHKLLQYREAELLAKLQELEDEFLGGVLTQQIKHLSTTRNGLVTDLKGSQNEELLKKNASIRELLERKLQTAKDNYGSVRLEWDVELEERLTLTGDILLKKRIRDYKKVEMPVASFGKHSELTVFSPGVFYYPTAVTVDPTANFLYITDANNNRVQVFNKSFEFVFMFSEKMDGPAGISLTQDKVYVTQCSFNCLNVYNTDGKYLQSVGGKGNDHLQFNEPEGLAVSTEMERIYIADFKNDRVQCLNLDLTFNSLITDIYRARDVKLTQECIVALSARDYCISLYSYSHKLIREMIPIGEGCQLNDPIRISLDTSRNIIITDWHHDCVCIYSYGGEFKHKFGREGDERGQFIAPTGVAVSPEGSVIVLSCNANHCIQIF